MSTRAVAFAVEASDNMKTGLVHATYASQNSCPSSCPLRGNGCYAESGPMAIWTRRVNTAGLDADPLEIALAEAEAISERLSGRHHLRLHVVGDCATNEAAAIVSEAALYVLKKGRKAWTYSHAGADVERRAWGRVSVLASAERPEQVLALQDKGYATAMVIDRFDSDKLFVRDGIKILPCPNQTRGVKCTECRLCLDDNRLHANRITIGFTPHGSRFKRVLKVLEEVRAVA